MSEETIGRRLRRYVRDGVQPNAIELTMAADRELWLEQRIAKLEVALLPFAAAWRRDPLLVRVENEAIAFARAAELLKD